MKISELLNFRLEQLFMPQTYRVNKLATLSLKLDGYGNSPLWEQANLLSQFIYPWNMGASSSTHFKALWNKDYFYFLYRISDPDIFKKTSPERPVVDSDRVEIFFKINDELNPYYSLEMDALGRVLSTKNKFYRNINMDWLWPKGHFDLFSSINVNGYTIEGKITLESLRELNLLQKNKLQAGLFRGEYFYEKNKIKDTKWISWVRPKSDKPDFHIASAFGVLELVG